MLERVAEMVTGVMEANGLDVDEIAASVGADSLGYISLEGMIDATRQPQERLCQACFTGEYPTKLSDMDGDFGSAQLSLMLEDA